MRPVGAKMCLYESLIDGKLSLYDVANMNDFLDVKAENERRYNEANK